MKKRMKKAFSPIQADQDLLDKTRDRLLNVSLNPGKSTRGRRTWVRGLAAATALLLLVGLFTVVGVKMMRTTVAAVSIDINPSIELQINALSRVVSATAYNVEGETLLAELDLEGAPVNSAVSRIISAAARAGYVEEDGSSIIAITSSTDSENMSDKLESSLEEAIQKALKKENSKAVVFHDNTALARISEARVLGITPGRLNLIQKLQALNPETEVADYVDAKASEIMKEVVRLQNEQRDVDKLENKETKSSEQAEAKTTKESKKAAAQVAKEERKAAKATEMAEALAESDANGKDD